MTSQEIMQQTLREHDAVLLEQRTLLEELYTEALLKYNAKAKYFCVPRSLGVWAREQYPNHVIIENARLGSAFRNQPIMFFTDNEEALKLRWNHT